MTPWPVPESSKLGHPGGEYQVTTQGWLPTLIDGAAIHKESVASHAKKNTTGDSGDLFLRSYFSISTMNCLLLRVPLNFLPITCAATASVQQSTKQPSRSMSGMVPITARGLRSWTFVCVCTRELKLTWERTMATPISSDEKPWNCTPKPVNQPLDLYLALI